MVMPNPEVARRSEAMKRKASAEAAQTRAEALFQADGRPVTQRFALVSEKTVSNHHCLIEVSMHFWLKCFFFIVLQPIGHGFGATFGL